MPYLQSNDAFLNLLKMKLGLSILALFVMAHFRKSVAKGKHQTRVLICYVLLNNRYICKWKLHISKWLTSGNEGFALRFEDVYCKDATIWKGYDGNCRHRCASDDKCQYFSQWIQTSTWCQTYTSCTTQSTDTHTECAAESNGNLCPIETFEKISTFLNDLVNVVLPGIIRLECN